MDMHYTDERKKINDRESKRLREQQQDELDFKKLSETAEGRRFIRRLMDECGVYRISYAPEDHSLTAYREGRRSIGLWLLSLFEELPDTYIKLLTEITHE